MSLSGGSRLDPGLQLERTALAWARTALATAVAAVVAGRTLAPVLGPTAFLAAAGGLLLAAVVMHTSRRRYRIDSQVGIRGGELASTSATGVPVTALAISVLLLGLLALAFVLLA